MLSSKSLSCFSDLTGQSRVLTRSGPCFIVSAPATEKLAGCAEAAASLRQSADENKQATASLAPPRFLLLAQGP
jgi:hypothetical protein